MPPSAHAERTFNHTPNAHGAITQRQSTGFASRKLRVRIPFVPPIPKCPSLRMAMAEMPMSGARGCDQLAKRLTRWQMCGLDGNDCTVCIQECQICRIVPQPSIAHGAELCGKFHGVCWDGREQPVRRRNGRLCVLRESHLGTVRRPASQSTDARKKVIRDRRLLQYRSFRRIPLDRRGIPPPVYPAMAILPGYRGRRTYAAVAQRQRGCFVSSGFTVRIRAAAPPPLQDDPMLSGWLKVSVTAHNGCRSSVPCEKTSGQTAEECLDTSTFSGGWHALR